jgi:hypothetical protein
MYAVDCACSIIYVWYVCIIIQKVNHLWSTIIQSSELGVHSCVVLALLHTKICWEFTLPHSCNDIHGTLMLSLSQ